MFHLPKPETKKQNPFLNGESNEEGYCKSLVPAMPQASINKFKFSFPLIWTILSKHGQKSLLGGSSRENIRVQMCISATGKLIPPLLSIKENNVAYF